MPTALRLVMWLLGVIAVGGLIFAVWPREAEAHSWYSGEVTASGASCCNDRDCHQLAAGDVTEVSGGYYIKSLNETVPYGKLRASPDGKWHACVWGSGIQCFFGPLPGY